MIAYKKITIQLILPALALITASFVLMGCNTVEGAGTDIRHAGRAIEHAAEDAKQPCTPTAPCPPRTQSQRR